MWDLQPTKEPSFMLSGLLQMKERLVFGLPDRSGESRHLAPSLTESSFKILFRTAESQDLCKHHGEMAQVTAFRILYPNCRDLKSAEAWAQAGLLYTPHSAKGRSRLRARARRGLLFQEGSPKAFSFLFCSWVHRINGAFTGNFVKCKPAPWQCVHNTAARNSSGNLANL